MAGKERPCPHCGETVEVFRNPVPTVDIVIENLQGEVLLIERKNPPHGWALPGGFVDYGESVEEAAVREALEETGLEVSLRGLLGVYSKPCRDARQHTISITFMAEAADLDSLEAGDDAGKAQFYPLDKLPQLVFDHYDILQDYKKEMKARE
ncbi:MAG: NUDIX domain-containing protein [Desulfovibrio sp.]